MDEQMCTLDFWNNGTNFSMKTRTLFAEPLTCWQVLKWVLSTVLSNKDSSCNMEHKPSNSCCKICEEKLKPSPYQALENQKTFYICQAGSKTWKLTFCCHMYLSVACWFGATEHLLSVPLSQAVELEYKFSKDATLFLRSFTCSEKW